MGSHSLRKALGIAYELFILVKEEALEKTGLALLKTGLIFTVTNLLQVGFYKKASADFVKEKAKRVYLTRTKREQPIKKVAN